LRRAGRALAPLCAAVAAFGALILAPASSQAQRPFATRFSANTRGDITMAANSILTCRPGTTGGGVACATAQAQVDGVRRNNDFPMDLIDVDTDASTFDSSTSTLVLPAGTNVAWAGLYWHCSSQNVGDPAPVAAQRNQVRFRAPGAAAYAGVTASAFDVIGNVYFAFADVTAAVRGAGAGEYTVANIQCANSTANTGAGAVTNLRGGWALVVAYEDDTAPLRNLYVADAFQTYQTTAAVVPVSGFVTPASPEVVRSRVGIVLGDGDRGQTDTLSLRCTMPMSTATLLGETGPGVLNPTNDIGNSTITRFGAQTMRNPMHLNTLGWDADLFDTTGILPNSCRAAEVTALGSTNEGNAIGVITFATDIFAPEVSISKTAADVNGAPLLRGDEIEYTLVVRNTGRDPATGVVVRDPVPAGTTYVPGSLRIGGAARTDAAGDDTANFEAGTSTAVFRLGTGANATVGGQINPGATVTVSFRVRISPTLPGGSRISNTASATYNGLTIGAGTTFTASSDGDPGMPGDQPTDLDLPPVCGDGVITAPETCDDGNAAPGDGCNSTCRREVDITSPANGSTTNDARPTISGTADPGVTVTIRVDGVVVGTATAGAGGAWAFTPSADLADGARTITASATDGAGGMSMDSVTVTIDTVTTVAITSPATGSTTGDATPTISGTGEPGATVAVSVDGTPVGTATVGAGGTWSVTVATPLADGMHTAVAIATDAAGNMAMASTMFVVDASTFVTITGPTGVIGDATPTISGTSEPGAMVAVRVDGALVGTATADGTGAWSVDVADPLPDGVRGVSATATDMLGNVATASGSFEVDTGTVVAITAPADGGFTNDTTPTIRGTGEPGATVEVRVDGAVVGTATVAPDGTWSLTVPAPLAEGPHAVTVTATDGRGNTAMASSGFTVDTSISLTVTAPTPGTTTSDTTPTISGTTDPGATVEVRIDGVLVGTATADGTGAWSVTPTRMLGEGPHTATVTATDAAGNRATGSTTFTVDTTPPALRIVSPPDGSTTSDTTPEITGTAEPGAVVVVEVDGVIVGTVRADASGIWSVTPTTPLAAGRRTATATTADAAGNRVTASTTFTIDTAAPAVTIDDPASGEVIGDATPTLSGTATPGATVVVSIDGVVVGMTTAAADGSWSVEVTAPLDEGVHRVRADATDAMGRTGSDAQLFVVDLSTSVTVDTPADGSTVFTRRPRVGGRGEPGATVAVSIDGAPAGTATVGADGRWSLTVPSDLADGAHTVTATATDPRGNTASATATFTVDTTRPDSDGDGVPDDVECPTGIATCPDTDGDGTPDYLDPDDDGDGIPTADERPGGVDVDTDGDGTPDYLDPDDDGDGVLTRDELGPDGRPRDTDLDGIPDHLDADDDGDGIPTRAERPGGIDRDTDRDGLPDHLDPDDDGDGIPTAVERADGRRFGDDVDGDGDPNWLDTDSDGDGIDDRTEGTADRDGDGVPDYLDPMDVVLPDGGAGDGGVGDGGAGDGGVVDGGAGDAGGGDAGPRPTGGYAGGACATSAVGAGAGGLGGGALAACGALLGLALLGRRRRARGRSMTREPGAREPGARAARGEAPGAWVAAVLAGSAALGLGAGGARAQTFELDQYRAAPLPGDGFALARPNDLGHLRFAAQLHLDYANDPLVYEAVAGDASSERYRVVAHHLAAQVGLALGLADRVVVYAGLPVSVLMAGDDTEAGVLTADGTRLGDVRLGARVRLFGEDDGPFALALQLGATLPTARAADAGSRFAGEQGVTLVPALLAEVRPTRELAIAANVGARVRFVEPEAAQNLAVGQELTWTVGARYLLVRDLLSAHLEAFGTSPFSKFGSRVGTPVEGLLGLRLTPGDSGLALGLAGGAGLSRGAGSPDFRVLAQVGWAMPPPPAPAPIDETPPRPSDRDQDGLLDDADQCSDEPEDRDEFQDEDGCPDPDNDQDGVLDASDRCPLEAEDRDGFGDEDGCPDPDNDGDGVLDASDRCPNEPEDRDGFEDEDGCPDLDNDRDGVLDLQDQCPLDPGPASNNGCPVNVRVDRETGTLLILQRVEFATNRDVILPRSAPILEDVRAVMAANPGIRRLRIEGHTDDRGRDDRNLDLSARRARSVMRWLVEHGIEATRFSAFGCGELHPRASNRTNEGRQENRRVEFIILDPPPPQATQLREGCREIAL
jgi:uncharacterized repeat protein (TIGR01451 family)